MNQKERPYIPEGYKVEQGPKVAELQTFIRSANGEMSLIDAYATAAVLETYSPAGLGILEIIFKAGKKGISYEDLAKQNTLSEAFVSSLIAQSIIRGILLADVQDANELALTPAAFFSIGCHLAKKDEEKSNKLFLGRIEVVEPVAEEIYRELIAKDLYLTEDQAKRFKYTTRIFPTASFTHEECVAFVSQYQLLHGFPPSTAKFPLMQLNLIGNTICGTANVPDNSMFVGSTLAGRVVPPSEMFNVFEQISKDHRIAGALAGKAYDATHCMTVNFHGADWTVKIPEAYNYCVWFRDMTSMLLPEVKGPLLYLGNQVVSAEDSVAYYEDIVKAIFSTESLSKNYRYKPSIGALVGWSFTFEHIRQFKRDFDAMLVLTGNKEAPNQKTQVAAKFVLTGIHVPIHSAREVYDFLAGNADIQKYRTDPNGEDFAHADVVVNYLGNDQVITAAQGSKFMDDFKDLKKALKKPKVE